MYHVDLIFIMERDFTEKNLHSVVEFVEEGLKRTVFQNYNEDINYSYSL